MNTATGTKQDNAADQDLDDRRRGMKLVAGKKVGKAFRIEVADDMFATPRPAGDAPAMVEPDRNPSTNNKSPVYVTDGDGHEASVFGAAGLTFGAAVISGMILGYLAGRRRD